MGFIKASELMGSKSSLPYSNTATETLTHHNSICTSSTSSFIPASKLMYTTTDVARTQSDGFLSKTQSSSLLPNTVSNRHHHKKKKTESGVNSKQSTLSSLSTYNHHSASDHFESVSRLKRVKIDPSDLYMDTSSDEEYLDSSRPSVSGPGMGFRIASSLLTSPVTAPYSTTSITTESSGRMSSNMTSSVKSSSNTVDRRASTGCIGNTSDVASTDYYTAGRSANKGCFGNTAKRTESVTVSSTSYSIAGSTASSTAGTGGRGSGRSTSVGSKRSGTSSTVSKSRERSSSDCTITGQTRPLPRITNFFGK